MSRHALSSASGGVRTPVDSVATPTSCHYTNKPLERSAWRSTIFISYNCALRLRGGALSGRDFRIE